MRTSILGTASCLLMLTTGAQSDQSYYLKGVTIVVYHGAMSNKGPCKIDFKAWNTSIDFVANQSTKLALMTDSEHHDQIEEMREAGPYRALLKKGVLNWTDEDNSRWQEYVETQQKLSWAPRLSFVIETIDIHTGCAASINAKVTAVLKPSTMISTGASVRNPDFEIWSSGFMIQGPYQSFSKFAIETSERIMKSFVNDWAASQNLP